MFRLLWAIYIIILCIDVAISSWNLQRFTTKPKHSNRALNLDKLTPKQPQKLAQRLAQKLNYNPQKRIYGGLNVPIQEFPHIAQLVLLGTHFCMGSIINEFTIVTAAHCLSLFFLKIKNKPRIDRIKVYVGSHKSGKGTAYDVCNAVIHKNYRDELYPYDVAMIFLREPIEFNDKVQPIQIATNTDWKRRVSKISVPGFGIDETGSESSVLKATWMNYVNSEICNLSQHLIPDAKIPNNSMFCMTSQQWSSDCSGDSGSGIVWHGFLVGLVVAGLYGDCGSSLIPSVYTDLTYFKPWIEKHIQSFNEAPDICIKRIEKLSNPIESPRCGLSG